MSDPTESIRKELLAQINAEPGSREALEAEHGQVWDTNNCEEYSTFSASPLRWSSVQEEERRPEGQPLLPSTATVLLRFEPE